MDPLSDVLAAMDLRAASPSRLEAAGPWSLAFDGHRHLKIGTVLAGACILIPAGGSPLPLTAGDCYLLSAGHPYVVTSDAALEPVASRIALPGPWLGTARYGRPDGEPTIVVSGSLTYDAVAALVFDSLPPGLRIAADGAHATGLRPILELLGRETAGDDVGAEVMRTQLTRILFIQALRTLRAEGDLPGWLGALGDPRIGAALSLLHERPAHDWTVAELGAAVRMSRSSFAERFHTMVGRPPLDYLLRWRIQKAAHILRTTSRTVAAIGGEVGYASEGAFSNAFKRVTGRPPAHYRRESLSRAA
jgi:AraC-like DNA-binding protein